jgi:hypothetical protein
MRRRRSHSVKDYWMRQHYKPSISANLKRKLHTDVAPSSAGPLLAAKLDRADCRFAPFAHMAVPSAEFLQVLRHKRPTAICLFGPRVDVPSASGGIPVCFPVLSLTTRSWSDTLLKQLDRGSPTCALSLLTRFWFLRRTEAITVQRALLDFFERNGAHMRRGWYNMRGWNDLLDHQLVELSERLGIVAYSDVELLNHLRRTEANV